MEYLQPALSSSESEDLVCQVAKSAIQGWFLLAAFVAGYDLYAIIYGRETLSSCFDRGMLNKRTRWALVVFWSLLTKHLLLNKYAPKADPFKAVGLALLTIHTHRKIK